VIPKELIALVPKEVAIEHKAIPVGKKDGKLFVAMSDLDFMALDNLRFLLNQAVECAIASPRTSTSHRQLLPPDRKPGGGARRQPRPDHGRARGLRG
jgi:hypothetical protein